MSPTSVFYSVIISDATYEHSFVHPTAKPSIVLNNLDEILISNKTTGQYIHNQGVIFYPGYHQLEKIESENFYLSFLNNEEGKIFYRNKGFYEGVIFFQTRNLKGKIIFENGESYDGEWDLGLKHGQGKYIWANGDCYQGEWALDCMSGKGVLTLSDGNVIDGNWKNGAAQADEELKFFDPEGNEVDLK